MTRVSKDYNIDKILCR